MNQATKHMGYSVAQLHGQIHQRSQARLLMETSLERARNAGGGGAGVCATTLAQPLPGSSLIEEEVQVEQRWVGWLLGRGGGLAREIEQESGAKVTIDQSTKAMGYSTVRVVGEAG